MTTITNQIHLQEGVLSYNEVSIQVPQSLLESVLGEPTYEDHAGYFAWFYKNEVGLEVLLVGHDNSPVVRIFGESKMKDLNTGREIMRRIKKSLGQPEASFGLVPEGRNWIYNL